MANLRLVIFYATFMAPLVVGVLVAAFIGRRYGAGRGIFAGLATMVLAYFIVGLFVANR